MTNEACAASFVVLCRSLDFDKVLHLLQAIPSLECILDDAQQNRCVIVANVQSQRSLEPLAHAIANMEGVLSNTLICHQEGSFSELAENIL